MEKDYYDQAATVFSPEGRIFQVEYSREAVKRGGLAMGIIYKDGILFTIDKAVSSPLIEEIDLEKFFKITSTVGAAASGLIADARILIEILRDKAQEEKKKYGEKPDLKILVLWVSKIYEIYTRYEGVRPFGTALIIGGYDEQGFHVYETDPSGVFQERKATAIGKGSVKAVEILERAYVPDLSREEAIGLALRILEETLHERPQDIRKGEEIHILTRDGFEVLDLDTDVDIDSILKDVNLERINGKNDRGRKEHVEKTALESFLDQIPKLPLQAKKNIKDRFKDLKTLEKASEDDLMAVDGIGKATARKILQALKDRD
ncbi:MAG: archaeal proteasome endopeptidase complex subunit alpha [Candidatus Thermoplasmatota archaeon]|nr:archaeal proteasome endopeptidase complex subunit alpha [Candidatus Thermoplasmatota archaeon]